MSSRGKDDSHGGKPLMSRWSDLAGTSSGSGDGGGGGSGTSVHSLVDLSRKLDEANSALDYQRQVVNSLQAKVSLIEREMKRLMDENDYLLKCVQDPEFPQRQRSKETVQQLKQLQEARRGGGLQQGKIQPVYRQ